MQGLHLLLGEIAKPYCQGKGHRESGTDGTVTVLHLPQSPRSCDQPLGQMGLFCLAIIEHTNCPFFKNLQAKAGQLDVNVRESTTRAHVWTMYRPLGKVTRTADGIPRDIQMQIGKICQIASTSPTLHQKTPQAPHLDILTNHPLDSKA